MNFLHKCNQGSCADEPPSFSNKSRLMIHLKNVHIEERKETILCPEDGCEKPFSSSSAFSQHLSKMHPSWKSSDSSTSSLASAESSCQRQSEESHVSSDTTSSLQSTTSSLQSSDNEQITEIDVLHSIAIFYLQLESENLVPASTVQNIAKGIHHLNNISHSAISKILTQELEGKIPSNEISSILLRLKLNDPVHLVHHAEFSGPKFTTDFLRKQYYKKHFHYEEPVEYVIGPDSTLQDHTIAIVSIRRNLENMLKDPTIQKQVDASFLEPIPETRSYKTVIKNYTDGSIYIKRAKLYGRKRFCIVLFVDGFNPAKSSSREDQRYKTVGMYMSLLNLTAACRSKLSSVRLVMLVLNSLLKDHRKECFSHVINELKALLADGIDYKGEKIPVTLEKIAGDNLGQHMIAGFLECFNPNVEFACRYCEIDNKTYIKKPWVIGILRTRETYDKCVKDLTALKEQLTVTGKLIPDKVYSVKGIKLNSEFNEVPLFHVCDPHLSPCVGHDGFGGAWEADMARMVSYFVEKEWMTYKLLNDRIKLFKFSGSDSTNVPAAVKESTGKLGGHEVQNWTLIRLFVFFVGDLVQTSDPVWQLYLKLKNLIEYVCAPQLTLEQVCHMKSLSVEYLRARCEETFPIQMHTTIKTHYMVHFADLYELEGPLCQAWTLRFESKHAVLGRSLDMSKTHVNVLYTMSKKDQLYSSYLHTQEMFPEGPVDQKKACPMVKENYPADYQAVLQGRVFTDNAQDVQTVTVENQEFRRGTYLLLSKKEDNITVGKIMYIICDQLDTFFLLKKYESTLLKDYGVYELKSDQPSAATFPLLLQYSSSEDFTRQSVYDFEEKLCFSLKCAMLEESTLDNEPNE